MGNNKPETSVIIPVYNAAEFIEDAVKSVLAGTYSDFEIILVDDGSEDETLSLCKDLSAADDRIRVISIPHGGVSKARNVGLNDAKGIFIAFIDADDTVTEDYLQTLTDIANKNELDYVLCAWQLVFPLWPEAYPLERHFFKDGVLLFGEDARATLIEACFTPPEGMEFNISTVCMSIYRRSLLDEHDIRFSEEVLNGEDHIFIYTFSHFANGFAYTDKPMYKVSYRPAFDDKKSLLYFDIDNFLERISVLDKLALSFGDYDTDHYKRYRYYKYLYIAKKICEKNEKEERASEYKRLKEIWTEQSADEAMKEQYRNSSLSDRLLVRFILADCYWPMRAKYCLNERRKKLEWKAKDFNKRAINKLRKLTIGNRL